MGNTLNMPKILIIEVKLLVQEGAHWNFQEYSGAPTVSIATINATASSRQNIAIITLF